MSNIYTISCGFWNPDDVVTIDDYIVNGARSHGIKTYGLEGLDDTLNIVNTMMGCSSNDDIRGILKLKDIVINADKYKDSALQECWEANNYKNLTENYQFSKFSIQSDINFPLYLDKRNDLWMPQIIDIVNNNKAFIAVGLKHLFFKKGLIMQLQEKGYTVFPIKMYKSTKTLMYHKSSSRKSKKEHLVDIHDTHSFYHPHHR